MALLIAALMAAGVAVQFLAVLNPWFGDNYVALLFIIAAVLFVGFMMLRSHRNPRGEQQDVEPVGQNY
jgi:uncharacterized protein (DUF58 family)